MKIIMRFLFIVCFTQMVYSSVISKVIEADVCKFSSLIYTSIKGTINRNYSKKSSKITDLNALSDPKKLTDIRDLKDVIDLAQILKNDRYYFNPKELHSSGFKGDIPFSFAAWFRGASKSNYDLKPSLLRKKYPESTLIKDFKNINPSDHSSHFNDTFSWLTMGQHHGLPTRLLDWSESIIHATYFAVDQHEESKDQQTSHGKLFILNPIRLNQYALRNEGFGVCDPEDFPVIIRAEMAISNKWGDVLIKKSITTHDKFPTFLNDSQKLKGKSLEDFMYKHKLDCPIAVMPVRFHTRLKAQQGTFTIQGGIPASFRGLEELNEECIKETGRPFLFVVNVYHQKKIKEQLYSIGINEGTIYCDKDSQSRVIREKWEQK